MSKTLLFLFFLVSFLSISQTKTTFSKAKITYNTPKNFQKLAKAGIPIDHGQHKKGVFIISDFSNTEIEKAKKLGFQVDILIPDLEANFIKKNKIAKTKKKVKNPTCSTTNDSSIDYSTPTNFALGSMGGYLTYQEVLDNLDAMRNKYPSLISARANIGNFVTNGTPDNTVTPSIGGNALQWVRISDNPDSNETEPEILYDALHHAREPASLSQLIYYMWYLLENYDSDENIKQIIDNTELYFVPVVNPDGYLYNQKTNPNGNGFWRKNRFNTHGVDLNRNYDFYPDGTISSSVWGGIDTSTTDTSSDVYAGTGAFSEIETQAMKWFAEQHDFVIALNNHTSGDLLLFPYGYDNNKPTAENQIYEIVSKQMVSQNGFNNTISSGLYPAAGDSDDFMYGGTTQPHNKIFAFTPEIGNDFWPASNEIDGICKSMMYLNLMAAKMVNNYAQVESIGSLFVGENQSFDAEFLVKRFGLEGSGNFTVRIIPLSTNISGVGNSKSYVNLQIGSNISSKITIDLVDTVQIGDEISYTIQINGGSIKESINVTKVYGAFSTIVNNDANTINEYTNSGWATTTSTFVSSNASITDSPNGNYSGNQNKSIELTESIDLTDALYANVQFYAKWEIENNWDYAQFEVSIDNGSSWIPQCGKFTNPGSSNDGQPTGEPVYDGEVSDWVLEEIDLSDYLGKTIKVRFQFVSDSQTHGDGFYFDDLKINTIDQSTLSVQDNTLSEFKIFPNPSTNFITVQGSQEKYDLQIRNILGQEIEAKTAISGQHQFDLSTYPSGLYFVTITNKGAENTFKIQKK